jgi:arylsulfatase A-like enzyme
MLGARGTARPCAALAAAALALAACARAPGSGRPNVVLIVIDTVRADRLSAYGYARPTSPHIDALCERGIRFANAWSTSIWTLPAHASLFTGLYAIRHGATQEHALLEGGSATLAEILGAHGYATIGISANPLVSPATGLARGFDVFAATWRTGAHVSPDVHPNLAGARRFLERLAPGRPFFLFVNYAEAHEPYDPPEPHRSRFLAPGSDPALVAAASELATARFYLDRASLSDAELAAASDLYDAEIAHVDELVGALLAWLEQSGRLRDTLLILTSDHGENLGDHGHLRHVFNLYASAARVPLVIVPPGGVAGGAVRDEPVVLVDVFATILAQARIDPARAADAGRDLLAGTPPDPRAPLFAEYYTPLQAIRALGFGADGAAPDEPPAALAPYLRRLRSVTLDGWRLIASSDGGVELYDLASDPQEQRDLAGDARFAARERELRRLLDDFVARGGESEAPTWAQLRAGRAFEGVDAETSAALRALGYAP